jgi:hypothetical protein
LLVPPQAVYVRPVAAVQLASARWPAYNLPTGGIDVGDRCTLTDATPALGVAVHGAACAAVLGTTSAASNTPSAVATRAIDSFMPLTPSLSMSRTQGWSIALARHWRGNPRCCDRGMRRRRAG